MENRKYVAHFRSNNSISIFFDKSKPVVLSSDNPIFNDVVKRLNNKQTDDIDSVLSLADKIKFATKGKFTVQIVDNVETIVSNGKPWPQQLSDTILKFVEAEVPTEPLENFYEKLKLNPNIESVNSLYRFIEKNGFTICDDGDFIAYKTVNSDFTDCHTGTMDNSVGKIVSMPREQVDANNHVTCSRGLHAAAWGYMNVMGANGTNRIVVEVKINPKDVVSVPVDYNDMKMRCCEYLVLGVVSEPHKTLVHPQSFVAPAESPETDCDEDCGCACQCDETCAGACETDTSEDINLMSRDLTPNSEGRLLIPKELVKYIGSAGQEICLEIGDEYDGVRQLILKPIKNKQVCDKTLLIDSRGTLRISNTWLKHVYGDDDNNGTYFHIEVIDSNGDWTIQID